MKNVVRIALTAALLLTCAAAVWMSSSREPMWALALLAHPAG